tara:strand:+ start:406 stop:618 length:213 start_codon:yes stop_codon:yes gene_type:complete
MAQETIKFTIKQDGTVTEEVIGVVGPNCEKLTERIEEKLGNVYSKNYKPEFHQTQTVKDDVTLHMYQDSD